jgi:hypothetical protein
LKGWKSRDGNVEINARTLLAGPLHAERDQPFRSVGPIYRAPPPLFCATATRATWVLPPAPCLPSTERTTKHAGQDGGFGSSKIEPSRSSFFRPNDLAHAAVQVLSRGFQRAMILSPLSAAGGAAPPPAAEDRPRLERTFTEGRLQHIGRLASYLTSGEVSESRHQRLVAGPDDRGGLIIIDSHSSVRVGGIEGPERGSVLSLEVYDVQGSPRIVCGQTDGRIRVYDGDDLSRPLQEVRAHGGMVQCLAVFRETEDGRPCVVSGGSNGGLAVWCGESWAWLRCLDDMRQLKTLTVFQSCLDGRPRLLAAGDSLLRVYDLESGAALHELGGHRGYVWSLAWLRGHFPVEQVRLISGGDDASAKVRTPSCFSLSFVAEPWTSGVEEAFFT